MVQLWIPGPTEVRPELLAACARPMIGHRSGTMTETIERMDPHLRLAFGAAEGGGASVAVHSASASAMMEAALIGAGRGKVLCLVNGAFSKRWYNIALQLGRDARAIEVPMGEVVDLKEVQRVLDEEGPFDALTVVSSETSTGTATPLAPLGKLLAGYPGTLFMADLVSWIAGAPVDFDANRMDFGLAGVQKAFALPPGVAVVCASAAFMERARAQTERGFYLDPVRFIDGHLARKTPATPAISLYFALAQQLEDISAGVALPESAGDCSGAAAWQARFDKHSRMQARTVAWAAGHGLSLLPAPEHASPTVSCIRAGDLDVGALVGGLAERGYAISNGYGDLKGKTFRIGHMGDHSEDGLEAVLSAADDVLS
ncbi:MAG TPA: alanine--glyoxylate aminotransferase family protein [Planctomycetes bacterium]|nr:alanine--glyoxylate aminotransferase family protein [Planctomycetota bacterium]HIK61902.1 alanine--glyoxylate aminotransferase family protein [Planctomycetota bacterium]